MSQNEDFLWVITDDNDAQNLEYDQTVQRGIKEIAETAVSKGIQVPVHLLKSNFQKFFRAVIGLVSEIPEGDVPYVVDEIVIQAEISGSGEIKLLGGVSAGTKNGIMFKLKRKPEETQG